MLNGQPRSGTANDLANETPKLRIVASLVRENLTILLLRAHHLHFGTLAVLP